MAEEEEYGDARCAGDGRVSDAAPTQEGRRAAGEDWLLLTFLRGCWGWQPPSSQPSPSREKEKDWMPARCVVTGGAVGRRLGIGSAPGGWIGR